MKRSDCSEKWEGLKSIAADYAKLAKICAENARIASAYIDSLATRTIRADEIRLLPDGVSRYLFASWDELNAFIEDTATNMPYHTQKAFGVILDLEDSTYAMLSIAKGYGGDGEPSIVATLTTGQTTMYRCGYAEGYDLDTGAVEEWSWYDWQGNLSGSDNDVVRETTIDGWRVREWSNGECELWKTVEATANLLSWGNVYYAENAIPAQTYPVTFANAPQVQATPQYGNVYVYGLLSGTTAGTTTKSPSFCVWRANAASASIPVRVALYVKGTLA